MVTAEQFINGFIELLGDEWDRLTDTDRLLLTAKVIETYEREKKTWEAFDKWVNAHDPKDREIEEDLKILDEASAIIKEKKDEEEARLDEIWESLSKN